MKIIRNVVVYQCEWCGKKSVSAGGMSNHEKFCWQNPANKRMCFNCEHFHDKYPETLCNDSTDPLALLNAEPEDRPMTLKVDIVVGEKHTEFDTGYIWVDEKTITVTPYNYECKLNGNHMLNPYKTRKDIVDGLVGEGFVVMPTYKEGCPNFKKRETKF